MAVAVQPGGKARRLKLSIRFKLLLLISVLLLAILGTHLYLATSLFSEDKLAYIYDLSASQVATLTEQTHASLSVLLKESQLFVREAFAPSVADDQAKALAAELFSGEDDVLRVQLFRSTRQGTRPTLVRQLVRRDVAERHGVGLDALESLEHGETLPLAALVAGGRDIYLQNSSFEPDMALLTLAFRVPTASESRELVVVDFRHQRLLRIFGRSRVQEVYLVDERGAVLAHPEPSAVVARRDLSMHPLVRRALASQVGQGVSEYEDLDGEAFLGGYGRVELARAWVVTQVPKRDALRASRELVWRSSLLAVAVLLGGFIVTVFFSRQFTAPIRRLRAAAGAIGEGNFDLRIDVSSADELGDLATSLEQMARTLGQSQKALLRMERQAVFGELGAGMTHEVRNPITTIVGFAQLARRNLGDPNKAKELLALIESEGLRCRDILSNFLTVARTGGQQRTRIDVRVFIEECARLLKHKLQLHTIALRVEQGQGVPCVSGNEATLKQVVLNLAINAQQAIGEQGVVILRTARNSAGEAVVEVQDDGPGIPEDLHDKIFEPFFTTKQEQEGTGLGLAISANILQAHHGRLEVESPSSGGAIIRLLLPPYEATEVKGHTAADAGT